MHMTKNHVPPSRISCFNCGICATATKLETITKVKLVLSWCHIHIVINNMFTVMIMNFLHNWTKYYTYYTIWSSVSFSTSSGFRIPPHDSNSISCHFSENSMESRRVWSLTLGVSWRMIADNGYVRKACWIAISVVLPVKTPSHISCFLAPIA